MKKLLILPVSFLIVISLFFSQHKVIAGETKKKIKDAKPANVAKIIKPEKAFDLKKINKISVLVNSTSMQFAQTTEDYLTIKLRDNGFEVVKKDLVSETTMKELSKLQQQQEEKKDKENVETLNIINIGKKLGLDAVIIGSVFEGRWVHSFTKDNPPKSMEKIVVSTFYLQVVDIKTEDVVLAIVLEYDKGENLVNAVDTIVEQIVKELKG